MIEAKNLAKTYNGVYVLRGVSFSARRGEVTCIVGPNGSGKTTLLRILALLEKPDSGEVLYDGVAPKDRGSVNRVRVATAYVPQRVHVFPMSVYSNVYYALRSRGISPLEAARRTEEVLKTFELYDLRKKGASSLSGGQKQLLSIARAVAIQPEYMLLDEPTTSLDPERAAFVLEFLRNYAREKGAVVITVSHDILEVKEISGKTFVLIDGRVAAIFEGSPDVRMLARWLGVDLERRE